MVLPFLVLYLTRPGGLGAVKAGLVLGLFGICSLVSSPLFGRLCDRWGAQPVMVGSLFSTAAILLLFPFASGFAAVCVVAALLSVSIEAFRPASLAVLSELVPSDRRLAAFAVNRLAINLGMSIGPAVGGFLAEVDFRALFWVDAATSLAAGALVLFLGVVKGGSRTQEERQPAEGGTPAPDAQLPPKSRPGYRNRAVLVFLAAVILTGIVFFQHSGPLPLYLTGDLGQPARLFGILFTINTLMIVLFEVPLNLACSGVASWKLLTAGALLTGVGFGVLAHPGGVAWVVLSVVIWTLGEMCLFPSMSAWIADAAPPDRRGEYMGLFTMAFGAAFAIGPWLGVFAYSRFGAGVVWIGCLVVAALSAALFTWNR
jgi:MFS family permease